jgi:hypothetical protein
MRQSITKLGINIFLNEIKFSKEYYYLYNSIFNDRMVFTEEIFVYFILQIAHKNKFHGRFDELYVDVIKRQLDYIKELIANFRTSYIGETSTINKFYRSFCCIKLTDKEIYFNRNIILFDFYNLFSNYFEPNNEDKKNKFVAVCELIYDIKVTQELEEKINAKFNEQIKKRTASGSTKIFAI